MKARLIQVHPTHPQPRLVRQAADMVANSGVIVCPTDACYSLICSINDKSAQDRIRAIRHVEKGHYFTLLCQNVSELAQYGKVSNASFRLLRTLTPGPYTFILAATRDTPRRLQDPKRRMVGLRVPGHPFLHGVLETLGEPVMASTLMNDELDMPFAEPEDMHRAVAHAVDAVFDGGAIGIDMTTVLDLSGPGPELLRTGKGSLERVADLV